MVKYTVVVNAVCDQLRSRRVDKRQRTLPQRDGRRDDLLGKVVKSFVVSGMYVIDVACDSRQRLCQKEWVWGS